MKMILQIVIATLFLIVGYSPLHASQEQKISLDRWLIPDDHPAKEALDHIFGQPGVLSSIPTLENAGFKEPKIRPKGLIIGKHPLIKGYLLKMYLDGTTVNEEKQWRKRIEGADLIEKMINRCGYQEIMAVPKKWVYVLKNPSMNHPKPQFSVLVVKDMRLVNDKKNRHFYRHEITRRHLDALYQILVHCKLADSLIIQNIPLMRDGRIAFVDTEIAGKTLSIWLVIQRLGDNFSPEMKEYWRQLIQKGKIPVPFTSSNASR